MLDWEWYDDIPTTRLFIHLLMICNHSAKSWKGVHVAPGQVITGRQELAAQTGLSVQQVRTALRNQQLTNEITIKSTKIYSLITITKWNEYQGKQPSDQPTTNQQINPQTTTTKEEKKKRKITPLPPEGDRFYEFWGVFPKKRIGDKEAVYKSWLKAITKAAPETIVASARLYATSLDATKENAKYAAGGAKWLNNSGWTAQYDQPEKKQHVEPWIAAMYGGE